MLPDIPASVVEAWHPSRPKVLFFDIDETMVHCIDDRDPPSMKGNISLLVRANSDIEIQINLRPGLISCLQELAKLYQLVSFTASDQVYADTILDYIDPDREYFAARLYR